jgi:hypothetical protein
MIDGDRPYVIESPTRIRLGPEAKFWAQEHGLTLEQMAKYLLARERLDGDNYGESYDYEGGA